jgi:hypothetical protein
LPVTRHMGEPDAFRMGNAADACRYEWITGCGREAQVGSL